jgi:hypothetical protein
MTVGGESAVSTARHCEEHRDEAIQTQTQPALSLALDCRAPSGLAMTAM